MGTAINHAAAMKRLEALFSDTKIEEKPTPEIMVEVDSKLSAKCDVHGKNGRRGSLGNVLHITNRRDSLGNVISQKREGMQPAGYFGNGMLGPRRESMPALNNQNHYGYYRRGSLALPHNPPKKEFEHPSQFASMLRKDPLGSSTGSLRKDLISNRPWGAHPKRDILGGSMSALNNKNHHHLQVPTQMRRNSRNYSTDSLDGKRNSWDPGRRGSSGSSVGWEEPIWEDSQKCSDWIKVHRGSLLTRTNLHIKKHGTLAQNAYCVSTHYLQPKMMSELLRLS